MARNKVLHGNSPGSGFRPKDSFSSGPFGEYALHPIVDEVGPTTSCDLWCQRCESLSLEEWPRGDTGLGEQPSQPDSLGLSQNRTQQLPPDSTPLMVGRNVNPVDVPVGLQFREPDGTARFLGHRDKPPSEPPEPANRVNVVRRPSRDLCWGIVEGVNATDSVPKQRQERRRVVWSELPQCDHALLLPPNVRRQRAERLRTKNMEQPKTSTEATDSDRPNDVARLRCTPWFGLGLLTDFYPMTVHC
jgi:hypothetical protein